MPLPPQMVSLINIIADERAQSRAGRDGAAVAEYAEAMAAGAAFPPLVVFQEGDRYWLAEGFHRHAAGLAADLAELPCDVRQGDLRDAILHSAGANAAHGLRRTNADKRRAVLMLLQDEEWSKWSDREIGRQCVVDHKTVTRLREEHLGKSPDAPRTVSRGGTVYSMDTGRIGRQHAEPDPPAPASAPAQDPPEQQPSNVIQLGNRLNVIPSPEAIERGLIAEEAAADIQQIEDYDVKRLDHRATAVNYALGMLEHVPLTGKEYWRIYGKFPKREAYSKWVLAAKEIVDDIVREFDPQSSEACAAAHGDEIAKLKQQLKDAKHGLLPVSRTPGLGVMVRPEVIYAASQVRA